MSEIYRPPELSPAEQFQSLIAILPKTLGFLWRATPALLTISILCLLVSALVPALIIWFTKVIVDGVIEATLTGGHFTDLLYPVGTVCGLWIFQSVVGRLNNYASNLIQERAYNAAATQLIEKAATLDLAFFESPKFYDQLHHAKRQLWEVPSICMGVLNLLSSVVSLGAMAGLLSVLHPLAIVVLFVTVSPRIFVEQRFARKRFDLNLDLVREDRMADYMLDLLTEREHTREVRLFRLKGYFRTRFLAFREKYIKVLQAYFLLWFKVDVVFSAVSYMGIGAIYAYAVYQAVAKVISVGDLTLVVQAAQQSSQMMTSLIQSTASLYQSVLFVKLFFDLIEMDPEDVEGALARPEGVAKIDTIKSTDIAFHNVTFNYPINDINILNNLSVAIPAGKKVAIVGENGAGKTTMIKLISRFYDPTSGSITCNGVDLRNLNPEDWRSRLSVVFQDFAKYDLSVTENIGIGSIERIDEPDRIQQAAVEGGTLAWIEKLEKGFETQLGKRFQQGVDLSGGQWQQLAIARAFMSDAPVLILDEPTANLDPLREQELYDRISAMTKNRTVIYISHRFSTVRSADFIIVIEDGRVIEQGSHEELMSLNGRYAIMFTTQASRYL